ncbi:hypothetical protein RB195_007264 [Necator americanus]|uniref:Uncharacterized protein n=1 Tax=Necator americanus TaxID=51031 RepID=A0ABR1BWD5_NECAM
MDITPNCEHSLLSYSLKIEQKCYVSARKRWRGVYKLSSYHCRTLRIKMLQRNPLVAIACGQFALSLMQAMFMFYYVRIYLNVFQVPQQWFNIAQTLFLFWNAINDPLFGYMQDKPGSWLNSRPRVIRTFSPFLAIAFVFMWVPWSKNSALEGVHLIVSLFFYDAFYSAIGVAWSALFADSTKEPRLRVSAMKYSQIKIHVISASSLAIEGSERKLKLADCWRCYGSSK